MLPILLVLSLGLEIKFGCLGQSFEVERHDTGDTFVIAEISDEIDCADFDGYFRGNRTLGCSCQFGDTFYTPSGKCERLYDENSNVPGGKYQFDRSGLTDTGVSTMRAYCGKLNEHLYKCILLSTTTNTQLPVIFKGKDKREGLLGSCEVTGVSILHGCDARKLSQVTAKLVNFTEIYHLHLESPNEIDSLFEGELIEVTINCSNCGKGKLYLKFAGSTDLCEDKKILDDFITHCDLKNHLNSSYCPNYAPASDSNRGGNPKLTKGGEASAIVGPLSVCIVLVLIIACYYYIKRRRKASAANGEQERLVPVGEERVVAQPQLLPLQPQFPPNVVIPESPTVPVPVDESVESSATKSTTSSKSTSISLEETHPRRNV